MECPPGRIDLRARRRDGAKGAAFEPQIAVGSKHKDSLAERLERLHTLIQQEVDQKQLAGAVTILARHGKIVDFEGFFDTATVLRTLHLQPRG